jgi:hypothetical protein
MRQEYLFPDGDSAFGDAPDLSADFIADTSPLLLAVISRVFFELFVTTVAGVYTVSAGCAITGTVAIKIETNKRADKCQVNRFIPFIFRSSKLCFNESITHKFI